MKFQFLFLFSFKVLYHGYLLVVEVTTVLHNECVCYINQFYTMTYLPKKVCESFSERVSELTHPKLPIYSFEIYYNSKQ